MSEYPTPRDQASEFLNNNDKFPENLEDVKECLYIMHNYQNWPTDLSQEQLDQIEKLKAKVKLAIRKLGGLAGVLESLRDPANKTLDPRIAELDTAEIE